jgi:hypothetical protein
VPPLDEALAGYRSVTADDVARVASRVLGAGDPTVAVLAPGRALRGLARVA